MKEVNELGFLLINGILLDENYGTLFYDGLNLVRKFAGDFLKGFIQMNFLKNTDLFE